MRTSIEIDDNLLDAARRATGLQDEEAVVEAGLRLIVRLSEPEASEESRLREGLAAIGSLDEESAVRLEESVRQARAHWR